MVKNSLVTIIWAMQDRMFMIRGEIEKDMAIKMAEGVYYHSGAYRQQCKPGITSPLLKRCAVHSQDTERHNHSGHTGL